MNVTEAIHVQTLLIWLTDRHLTGDQGTDAARESAAVLAAAARRRLGAGPTPDQIHTAWDDLLTTCPGCPTCTPTTGQADRQDDTNDPAAQLTPTTMSTTTAGTSTVTASGTATGAGVAR